MTAGLPLIKYVLTKNISILLGLSTGMSEADAAIQKKKLCIRNYSINNFK